MNETFDHPLDNGRIVKCFRVDKQEYLNGFIETGVALNFPPEAIYLRLSRNKEKDEMLFFRRDETQVVAWLLNGALAYLDQAFYDIKKKLDEDNATNDSTNILDTLEN